MKTKYFFVAAATLAMVSIASAQEKKQESKTPEKQEAPCTNPDCKDGDNCTPKKDGSGKERGGKGQNKESQGKGQNQQPKQQTEQKK